MALEIPFVTQTCAPCASLQLCSTLMTMAAFPAFYAGFVAKQNMSMAEEGVRMFVKRDVTFVRRYEVACQWDRYLQRMQLNKDDLKSICWSTCSSHFKVNKANENNEPRKFVCIQSILIETI